MIPLIDVQAQNLALESGLFEAFSRVLHSGRYIMGPDVTALEEEIARLAGGGHGIGVSSGTDALLLALMTLGVGPGDEVLCPAFTFFATAGSVARVGATPVFVDADPVSYNLCLSDAARKVTSRTKGILPVHLFGQCADMEGVQRLAEANHLWILEDAAQSLGAADRGRPAGSMGVFGAFSFYPTKNLGGLGDGGMLVCGDAALARKARALRNHGAEQTYHHTWVGGNFRLDSIQAAFLRLKLGHYSGYTQRRTGHARRYTEMLSQVPGVALGSEAGLKEGARLILPAALPGQTHIWNQYTLRVPGKRDAFRAFLSERGIQTGVYYPVALHQQECFGSLRQQAACPVAAQLANEVVSLPIYPELTDDQTGQVISAVTAYCRQN